MDDRVYSVSAVILAGGKSSRMGYKCKAELHYQGRTFLEIMSSKVKDFNERMIVTSKANPIESPSFRIVQDIMPNMGPLCGIYSALLHISNDKMVIIPVDTPNIPKELLEYLIEVSAEYDAVVPRDGDHFQPLCGIYSKSCLPKIKEALMNGATKPIDLFDEWNIRYVTRDEIELFGAYEDIFFNINTLREYNKLTKGVTNSKYLSADSLMNPLSHFQEIYAKGI